MSATVWILEEGADYDVTNVMGVYSTRELALAGVKKLGEESVARWNGYYGAGHHQFRVDEKNPNAWFLWQETFEKNVSREVWETIKSKPWVPISSWIKIYEVELDT